MRDVALVERAEVGRVAGDGGGGGGAGGLAVGAVVDEAADGDAGDQLGNAAGVVLVEVGDEDGVDAGEAGLVGKGDDAIGVAAGRRAGLVFPAGIDQQRLAVGRDEQRGLAAFDIGEEDVEVPAGAGCPPGESGWGDKQADGGGKEARAHGGGILTLGAAGVPAGPGTRVIHRWQKCVRGASVAWRERSTIGGMDVRRTGPRVKRFRRGRRDRGRP